MEPGRSSSGYTWSRTRSFLLETPARPRGRRTRLAPPSARIRSYPPNRQSLAAHVDGPWGGAPHNHPPPCGPTGRHTKRDCCRSGVLSEDVSGEACGRSLRSLISRRRRPNGRSSTSAGRRGGLAKVTRGLPVRSAPVDGARPPPRGSGLTCPARSDRIGARCHGSSAL